MNIYGLRLDYYDGHGYQNSQFVSFFDKPPEKSLQLERVAKTLDKSVDHIICELDGFGHICYFGAKVVFSVRVLEVEHVV